MIRAIIAYAFAFDAAIIDDRHYAAAATAAYADLR